MWLSPASDRSDRASSDRPEVSPVRMALKKAATSPSNSAATWVCMARAARAGHHRGEPAEPSPQTASSPRW